MYKRKLVMEVNNLYLLTSQNILAQKYQIPRFVQNRRWALSITNFLLYQFFADPGETNTS